MVQAGGLEAEIKATVESNKVVVYSKSYCPFAGQTKTLLSSNGIDAKIFELDQMGNGADIQNTLKSMTGQSTVPNVWIAGKHIGGNSDIQALGAAKVKEMIAWINIPIL